MSAKQRFNLTIEAPHDPHDRSAAMRLKLALKAMLRQHGLRCLDIHEQRTPDEGKGHAYSASVIDLRKRGSR